MWMQRIGFSYPGRACFQLFLFLKWKAFPKLFEEVEQLHDLSDMWWVPVVSILVTILTSGMWQELYCPKCTLPKALGLFVAFWKGSVLCRSFFIRTWAVGPSYPAIWSFNKYPPLVWFLTLQTIPLAFRLLKIKAKFITFLFSFMYCFKQEINVTRISRI